MRAHRVNIAPLSILGNAARNHKEIVMTMHQPEPPEPQATPVQFGYDAWIAQDANRRSALAEELIVLKASLFDFLEARGIIGVTVDFDGYGDSGQIEHILAFDKHGEVAVPEGKLAVPERDSQTASGTDDAGSVEDVIEFLVYDLLQSEHGGWENNEGAYGEFHFDVTGRSIKLAYHERITTSEYSETSW